MSRLERPCQCLTRATRTTTMRRICRNSPLTSRLTTRSRAAAIFRVRRRLVLNFQETFPMVPSKSVKAATGLLRRPVARARAPGVPHFHPAGVGVTRISSTTSSMPSVRLRGGRLSAAVRPHVGGRHLGCLGYSSCEFGCLSLTCVFSRVRLLVNILVPHSVPDYSSHLRRCPR